MNPASCASRPEGGPPNRFSHPIRAYVLALLALFCTPSAGHSEDREIAKARAAERKIFTDAEIADGFFKITFGAEFDFAGRTDRIRKYDGPVRVHVINRARPDRRSEIAKVIADIRGRIKNLDIAIVDKRERANVIVRLVRDRDLRRTIRTAFGRDQARRIQRSLEPQCLSGFTKGDDYRILDSKVILVADAGDAIFYDCAYEELLQSLGPINDDETVPWTMFNDEVQMGFFDVYDQYILNILYDPRIRAGMTREEVRALLPEILPAVREWVARVNNLKP